MVSRFAELNTINNRLETLSGGRAQQKPISVKSKPVVGTEVDESNATLIPAGETRFFQTEFRAAMSKGDTEDFYIEAFGDQGGYGHSQ